MKIVYVFPQLAHQAGTERILIDKMNYLADRYGYEVYALTYEQGQAPIAYSLSEKVRHTDLATPFWKLYKYNRLKRYWLSRKLQKLLYQRFMTIISDIHPDILIATPYHEHILEMIVQCPIDFKRIIESHLNKRFSVDKDPILGRNLLRKIFAWRKIQRIEKFISRFDYLVALNDADADDWAKCVKTRVITNMVHLNTGKLSSLNEKKVVFAGRYTKQKGLPDLFRVWDLVNDRHPDWHLYLYGEVGEDYEFACKEAKISNKNIHVNKSILGIFDEYRKSSIFVLTSIYEPFGLVMPEAMSCGLPVVAFDCPYGPANIITDGKDGFLIKNRDIQSFANRLCLLMENENLRKKMGQNAVASSQRYSADRIMPKWKMFFEAIVKD